MQTQRNLKMELIRKEIDTLLYTPLSDEEWNDLVQERYIEEILNDETSISEVAEKVRNRRQVYGKREKRRRDETDMLSKEEAKAHTERSIVLSTLIFEEASQDSEVQAFRTEVLAGTLLSIEAAHEWIQQQAQADRQPTLWLKDIPVPREYVLDTLTNGVTQDVPSLKLEVPAKQVVGNCTIKFLHYGRPDGWVYVEPTCIESILERLRLLSERLESEYSWSKAQATLFVLTGKIPLISPLRVTLKMRSAQIYSRILLDVDPTLSPQEVAKQYRLNRKKIIATRHRNLSKKHMQLAMFDAERPTEETWAEKLAEWNKKQPSEWAYSEVSNFAHDCLQARRRLLRQEKE